MRKQAEEQYDDQAARAVAWFFGIVAIMFVVVLGGLILKVIP